MDPNQTPQAAVQPENQNTSSQKTYTNKVDTKRTIAGFIDLVLGLLFLNIFGQGGLVSHSIVYYTNGTHQTNTTLGPYINFHGGMGLVCIVVLFTYFVLLEAFLGGTAGKWLTGLKVIDEKAHKITIKASLIRNVLRIVDAFPYFLPYLLGTIIMVKDDKRQRLGDRIAKTFVVGKVA